LTHPAGYTRVDAEIGIDGIAGRSRAKRIDASENTDAGDDLKSIRSFCTAALLAATLGAVSVRAQQSTPNVAPEQSPETSAQWHLDHVSLLSLNFQQGGATTDGNSSTPGAPAPQAALAAQNNPANPQNSSNGQAGRQPKRILAIIPNYRAVSANTHLPPLSLPQKFWLATQDSFDYSDFIFVAGLAGISYAQDSQPSFGQNASGYGQYYWHIFVDGAIENYMTEAVVPVLTKEDPRYYTLGKGGFFKRTGYAISQLFITRTDRGHETFNISEIVGAGAAAGIGNAYYPPQSNPLVKTYQRWGTQVGLDGLFNVLKEFWPDIDQKVFHGKY
jgi:hypothetical protein